jgi:hypothetical protein
MEKKLQDLMTPFIGTKLLKAVPMTRGDYNVERGWQVPENEDPADEGYLVMYLDGGKPNHPNFEGYISWSPKDVFERSYQPTSKMSFGQAIELVKKGAWIRSDRMSSCNASTVLAMAEVDGVKKLYYYNKDTKEFMHEYGHPFSVFYGIVPCEEMLRDDWSLVIDYSAQA